MGKFYSEKNLANCELFANILLANSILIYLLYSVTEIQSTHLLTRLSVEQLNALYSKMDAKITPQHR